MSCKNVNPRFTFLYLVAFSQGQQETKKAIVSSTSKILLEQFVETYFDLSKSCKDREDRYVYIKWRFVVLIPFMGFAPTIIVRKLTLLPINTLLNERHYI